jgi:hypothetical protein
MPLMRRRLSVRPFGFIDYLVGLGPGEANALYKQFGFLEQLHSNYMTLDRMGTSEEKR